MVKGIGGSSEMDHELTRTKKWQSMALPASVAHRLHPALLILSIVFGTLIFPWASQFPGGLIRDDGFFYAQIAYNIAENKSSSFDLINQTDGYHELWALILASTSSLLSAFTQLKPMHLLAYVVVNTFIILLTTRIFALSKLDSVLLATLLLSCSLLMEGHLALFLCAVGMVSLERSKDRARLSLLIALALLPLTRIDATVIGVFLVCAAAITKRRRIAVLMGCALLVGVACHFIYLRLIHGTFFTVSSQIKAGSKRAPIEQLLENVRWGAESTGLPIPVGPHFAIFALLAISSAWMLFTCSTLRNRRELQAFWLGALTFTLSHAVLNTLRPWYYTVAFGVFGYTLLVGIAAIQTAKLREHMRIVCVAVMLLPTAALGFMGFRYLDEARHVRSFVNSIDRYVPKRMAIYMVDGSGFIGWTSDRQIVNGDGLVNSHDYERRLKLRDLGGYLRENGIQFFMTNTLPAGAPILIDNNGLVVRQDEATLIAEKQDGGSQYRYTQFRLWKLR